MCGVRACVAYINIYVVMCMRAWCRALHCMALQWVNVFKPGKGTITIWENVGGTRGQQIYQLKGIPLTPGAIVMRHNTHTMIHTMIHTTHA